MRPLSFTKNIGGIEKIHAAIRTAYYPGVTVPEFRRRCGLNSALSLFAVEFFLCTQIRGGQEYILHDTLIEQSLVHPNFDALLARLYFFALNLGLPGERLRHEQQDAGALQRWVLSKHIYNNGAWRSERIDKDSSLEPFVKSVANFPSVRKWVNNYWFLLGRCNYVERPDGIIETFPDTWGLLALRLFFDRYAATHPKADTDNLASAALAYDLHTLIGVEKKWVERRVEGSADMFFGREAFDYEVGQETERERDAAKKGKALRRPRQSEAAGRREMLTNAVIRRGANRRFIQDLYHGVCQISGTILRLPENEFTVDCAHIRPLGIPHNGPDDVSNMLSLSPTMHRLFDRGCIRIDPESLRIRLLHGNDQDHLPTLLLKDKHRLLREHIAYFNANLLK